MKALKMKDVMRIVMLAAATAGTLSCTEHAKATNMYSVLLHGASYHSNQHKEYKHETETTFRLEKKNYNQTNLGLGFEVETENNVVFRAGTYKDSYYKQAKYATIGYRNTFLGSKEGFHVGASVNAGLLYGSGNHGLAATPQLEIGYKKVTLETIFIPKVSKDTCNAVAVSLKLGL